MIEEPFRPLELINFQRRAPETLDEVHRQAAMPVAAPFSNVPGHWYKSWIFNEVLYSHHQKSLNTPPRQVRAWISWEPAHQQCVFCTVKLPKSLAPTQISQCPLSIQLNKQCN